MNQQLHEPNQGEEVRNVEKEIPRLDEELRRVRIVLPDPFKAMGALCVAGVFTLAFHDKPLPLNARLAICFFAGSLPLMILGVINEEQPARLRLSRRITTFLNIASLGPFFGLLFFLEDLYFAAGAIFIFASLAALVIALYAPRYGNGAK
jgi:hypothetical protein